MASPPKNERTILCAFGSHMKRPWKDKGRDWNLFSPVLFSEDRTGLIHCSEQDPPTSSGSVPCHPLSQSLISVRQSK
jgi:hypothetical protein